jgi:hypothetical protein
MHLVGYLYEDVKKLVVASHNFTNEPKNLDVSLYRFVSIVVCN